MCSSDLGMGKTHLAAAIANQAAADGIDVVFQPVPDLLDWLRASYSAYSDSYQERFDRIRTVPVLILDDLGAESGTEWAGEKNLSNLKLPDGQPAGDRDHDERGPIRA